MKTKRSSTIIIAMLALSTLLLSACSAQTPNGKSSGLGGFFQHYLVNPFSISIHSVAEFFNGNYGLAIIIVTLIIRLALMPLMLRQYKHQMAMKEKMDGLKP